MDHSLAALNEGMPANPRVKILQKKGGWIAVSPFEPQAEPENLGALKAEVARRWPMTRLLDILKETDHQVGFTQCLRSGTEREHLDRRVLRRRLLLCLYGLGTNTGLKPMASPEAGNGRCGEHPAPLHPDEYPAPGLQGFDGARQGHQDDLSVPLPWL